MAINLRTRLFLTVAMVLAASIAVSSLLSRRATLVEVHEIRGRPMPSPARIEPIRDRVQGLLAGSRSSEINAALVEGGRTLGRSLLLLGPGGAILGASDPHLIHARVGRGATDDDLTIEMDRDGALTAIAVRGAPPVVVRDDAGRTAALLYALPPDEDRAEVDGRVMSPWILTTVAIGSIALLLMFALSRRILRPVSEITVAAERMQRGDLGVQVVVRGRDEISDLARAFNSMSSRLADVERLRRQMAGDVAHELRSPVTNLRCSLEAIQDGLAPADRASIDALYEETILLERLINDLQDLALAEAGRLELHMAPVDLEAVLRRAALPGSVNTTGADVAVDIEAGLPAVNGDRDRLDQVFRNLISNARRHTAAGGSITVTVRRMEDAVRVEVHDTGEGIHAEHLPHVFDRFYRADASRSRTTGGAGLGLAIVRQLVSAHGGSVAARSDGLGTGATFAVTLPAKA